MAAFSLTGASPTYEADRFSPASSNALVLAGNNYLTVAANYVPYSWISSTSGYSATAWVNCSAPNNANELSAVLELGTAGDASGAASSSALALVVGGTTPRANSGVVTTRAGSGSAAFSDGTGTNAALSSPAGIVVDASGTAYIADSSNNRIRAMTPAGVVTTLAGGGSSSFVDGTGTSALFSSPRGLAILSSGLIIVADTGNRRIRQVTSAGVVTTLCGSGSGTSVDGTGTSASFVAPSNIAVIPGSNIIVVSDGNQIRLVTTGDWAADSGVVTTLAGSTTADKIDATGTNAAFNSPRGIAVVPIGASNYYLLVCDTVNNALRKVTYPGGVVTTIAGGGLGYADGMGTSAQFRYINSIAILPSRATYSAVVVVTDAGQIGSATSEASYLRIVDLSSGVGVVTTLAGSSTGFADGTGANAKLYNPSGIAVDPSSGSLVVSDSGGNRIRRVALPPVLPACDSTWHHVALTYSFGSVSAFVDGALVFSQSGTITLPESSASLRVGWSGDLSTNDGSLFAGSMSDLRIYGYALSAAQVASFVPA